MTFLSRYTYTAPFGDVKRGVSLVADAESHACLDKDGTYEVMQDVHGLYAQCRDGKHYLCGHLNVEDTHYVGFKLRDNGPVAG